MCVCNCVNHVHVSVEPDKWADRDYKRAWPISDLPVFTNFLTNSYTVGIIGKQLDKALQCDLKQLFCQLWSKKKTLQWKHKAKYIHFCFQFFFGSQLKLLMWGTCKDNDKCLSFSFICSKKEPVDKSWVKVVLLRRKTAYFCSTCFNHTQQNDRKQRKIVLKNCSCAVTLKRISSEHTL